MAARSGSLARVPLTVVAQALSSLTNFVTSVFALSAGDLEQFGRFSIAFQLCVIMIALGEGTVGATVLVHGSADFDEEGLQRFRAAASATALWVGLSCAILLAATGLLVGGELGGLLLISAVGAPGIVCQYALRSFRFARQDQLGVVRADLIWLGTVVAVAAVDWVTSWNGSPVHYLSAWLLGATISSLPMIASGLTSDRGALRRFWQQTGPQAIRLGVESALARSVLVVTFVSTGVIAGASSTGAIAAAVVVFSPLTVVNTSAQALVVPHEIRARGIHVVRRSVPITVVATVAAVTAGWALAVIVLDRSGFGFGPFRLSPNGITAGLFAAILMHFLALAVWRGPAVAFRIADATAQGLDARLRTTAMQWTFPTIGLWLGGLNGGATALAIATWLGALIAWRRYLALDEAFPAAVKIAN